MFKITRNKDYIAHYGVKGMKWDESKKKRKTEETFEVIGKKNPKTGISSAYTVTLTRDKNGKLIRSVRTSSNLSGKTTPEIEKWLKDYADPKGKGEKERQKRIWQQKNGIYKARHGNKVNPEFQRNLNEKTGKISYTKLAKEKINDGINFVKNFFSKLFGNK